jgi:hypothetical protein
MSLWIPNRNISPSASISIPEFDHYLAIYTFSAFVAALSISEGVRSGCFTKCGY